MKAQYFGLLALLLSVVTLLPYADGAEKTTVGWVEKVRVYPGNFLVEARVDTGADTSSLHCDWITSFDRSGEKWVRFVVETSDGKPVLMERKVVRMAKIKRHFGEVQERMVVKLRVCLGKTYKEAEVTVVDRSGLTYPMLVGRDFLEGGFLVDPSVSYKTEPQCKVPKK
jgi:hypothetical protein